MGNILNHNRMPFETSLSWDEYWDFSLYLPQRGGWPYNDCGLYTQCLAAYIDTAEDECIAEWGLQSMEEYKYSECKSDDLELKNMGFTATDNGLIRFDKYTITDEEFANILKHTVVSIDKDDCRLKLHSVGGNNDIYNYSSSIVEEDGMRCAKLNGGFFQGFYMAGEHCEYKTLPNTLEGDGWTLEFELKRSDFTNRQKTLNSAHPENKGIFFFMGVRAENKWVKYYESECEFPKSGNTPKTVPEPYLEQTECTGEFDACETNEYYPYHYIAENDCDCADYFKEAYMSDLEKPEGNVDVKETNDGHYLDEANLTEIESDNKYLMFDRTCHGVTVLTYKEGDTALIQYRTVANEGNNFLLFNRSCDGMTVLDYDKYEDKKVNTYNVYDDLYKNAFALQVKDDGSVGYKYFVKDCESETPECSYKIESEFTNPNEMKGDEWANIDVRINRLSGSNLMRVMIYVDGRLKLVSKELPTFDFRKLNDTWDKQEGVPFNISLGGGTQGLCDVIYNEYMDLPEYVYPLEKEFGGSFIGYLKSFKFYACSLNYNRLNQNIYSLS